MAVPRWRAVFIIAVLGLGGCVTVVDGDGPRVGSAGQRLRSQLDLGRGYLRAGEMTKARAALDRALKIDSGSWEAHDLTATLHRVEGENALAERDWRNAIRYGGGARARRNFADYLMHHDRTEEACRELQAATDDIAYEHRSQVFQDLGTCELSRGQKQAALVAFRRATELNDTQPDAWLGVAELALDVDDAAAANAAYQKYRKMAQQTPRSLLLGVRIGRALKDVNAEASYALLLRNLYPESAEYRRYQEMRP